MYAGGAGCVDGESAQGRLGRMGRALAAASLVGACTGSPPGEWERIEYEGAVVWSRPDNPACAGEARRLRELGDAIADAAGLPRPDGLESHRVRSDEAFALCYPEEAETRPVAACFDASWRLFDTSYGTTSMLATSIFHQAGVDGGRFFQSGISSYFSDERPAEFGEAPALPEERDSWDHPGPAARLVLLLAERVGIEEVVAFHRRVPRGASSEEFSTAYEEAFGSTPEEDFARLAADGVEKKPWLACRGHGDRQALAIGDALSLEPDCARDYGSREAPEAHLVLDPAADVTALRLRGTGWFVPCEDYGIARFDEDEQEKWLFGWPAGGVRWTALGPSELSALAPPLFAECRTELTVEEARLAPGTALEFNYLQFAFPFTVEEPTPIVSRGLGRMELCDADCTCETLFWAGAVELEPGRRYWLRREGSPLLALETSEAFLGTE